MPCLAVSLPLLSQLITVAGGQAALGGSGQGPGRQTLWQQQALPSHIPHSPPPPSLANLTSFLFCLFSQRRTVPVNCQVRVKTISQHGEQKEQREMISGRQSVLEQLIHTDTFTQSTYIQARYFSLSLSKKHCSLCQKTLQCKARFYWVMMF